MFPLDAIKEIANEHRSAGSLGDVPPTEVLTSGPTDNIAGSIESRDLTVSGNVYVVSEDHYRLDSTGYGSRNWTGGSTTLFTLSAWIKTTDNDLVVVSSGNTAWGTTYASLGINGDGKALARHRWGNGFGDALGTTDVSDGEWHFIFAEFESTSLRRMYVDGLLETTDSSVTLEGTPTLSTQSIGRISNNSADGNYSGYIDSVMLTFGYNHSENQVLNLFNAGRSQIYTGSDQVSGPWAFYTMDE